MKSKNKAPAMTPEILFRVIWQVENEAIGHGCAYCGSGAERGVCGNCVSEDALLNWWNHVGRKQYAPLLLAVTLKN